jgi:hypothetical protein
LLLQHYDIKTDVSSHAVTILLSPHLLVVMLNVGFDFLEHPQPDLGLASTNFFASRTHSSDATEKTPVLVVALHVKTIVPRASVNLPKA